MRMRATVARALGEAEMRFLADVVHSARGEGLERLGQSLGEIRRLDRLGNFRLRQLGRVHDERLMLDERPFNGSLIAINIDALAILARGVEEGTDDARIYVGALIFDVRRLDGEGRAVVLLQFLAHGAGAEATD